MTDSNAKASLWKKNFSSDSIEVFLAACVIVISIIIAPVVAFFTKDWLFVTMVPLCWIALSLTIVEPIVDIIIRILIRIDKLIDIKGHYDKSGLILCGAFLYGSLFLIPITIISVIGLLVLG